MNRGDLSMKGDAFKMFLLNVGFLFEKDLI